MEKEMKNLKKAAGFLLSLVMALSLLPGFAFADGSDPVYTDENTIYTFAGDTEILPGWGGSIQKEYDVRIILPDGERIEKYPVLDVKVESDPAEVLWRLEKEYADDDPSSENYWWQFEVKQGVFGTAVLRVFYQDLNGIERSYLMDVNVVEDLFNINLIGEEGLDSTLPGKDFGVAAMINWRHYDKETQQEEELPLDCLTYRWEVIDGVDLTTLTPDSAGKAVLETETGRFDTCTTIPLRKPNTDERIDRYIGVDLTILRNGAEVGHQQTWIHVATEFFEILPAFVEYNLAPGAEETITPEVRRYQYGAESETVPNALFTFDYPEDALQVTPNGDGSFTLRRTSIDFTGFRMNADWQGEHLDRWYQYRNWWFNPYFEYEDDRIYSDGEKTIFLNLEELKEIDYEFAVLGVGFWKNNGSEFVEFTKDKEYTWKDEIDGNGKVIGRSFTFYGDKVAETLKTAETEGDIFVHVDIDMKGDIWLASADAQLRLEEAETEWHVPQQLEMLPEQDQFFNHENNAWIRNGEHPDGVDCRYTITEITSSNPAVVSVEKLNDGWKVVGEMPGEASIFLNCVLDDGAASPLTLEIPVSVKLDIYHVNLVNLDNTEGVLPNGSRSFQVSVQHSSFDPDTNRYSDEDITDQVSYQWSLLDGGPDIAVLNADKNSGVVTINDFPKGEWFSEEFRVRVEVQDGGETVGTAEERIYAADGYYEVWPRLIGELKPGESTTVTAEVRRYSYALDTPEKYEVVDQNCRFQWDYNPDFYTVQDADGTVVGYDRDGNYQGSDKSNGMSCEFTITRSPENFWGDYLDLKVIFDRVVDEPDGRIWIDYDSEDWVSFPTEAFLEDTYELHLDAPERKFQGFPGEKILLQAFPEHFYGGQIKEVGDFKIEWSVAEDSVDHASITVNPDNQEFAEVLLKASPAEQADPGFGGNARIIAKLFVKEDGEWVGVAQDEMRLGISNQYDILYPTKYMDEDQTLIVGETYELPLELREYSTGLGTGHYQLIQNVTFKINFDEECFEVQNSAGDRISDGGVIEKGEQIRFTIKPLKSDEFGYIQLRAVYTGNDGRPLEYRRSYAAAAANGMLGDLNADGKVSAQDLTKLSRVVAGIETIRFPQIRGAADVNRDRVVDAQDLTCLAKYIARITDGF